MIYCEAFCMRRHTEDTENLQINDAASWTFVCSTTVHKPMWLQSFVVGEVVNPFPKPRLDMLEIDGANGELDMTEVDGRLLYKRKKITVSLQHKTTVYEPPVMSAINERLRPWHGALVDVAFALPSEVEVYYTGRIVESAFDREKERITLGLDVQPFAYKAKATSLNPDRSARVTAAFEVSQAGADIIDVSFPSTHDIRIFGGIGAQVKLRVSATMPEGVFAFGVDNARGGSWYISRDEITYTRLQRMSTSVVGSTDGSGNFYITFTIDGSAYGWVTDNGTRKYVPCLIVNGWELLQISTDENDENVVLLEPNASIRVEALNVGGEAVMVVDGKSVVMGTSETSLIGGYKYTELDGVWLPSANAKKKIYEGHGVWSVLAYANNGNVVTNANVTFSFREEVLHE